jgi:RimJ/RimL family protein N-acetyltransferase
VTGSGLAHPETGGRRLETARLRLVPLTAGFAAWYDERECQIAEDHWRRHGFGHWAVLERQTNEFLGAAEVHFAHPGVEGISIDEVEIGVEILPAHQRQGYAKEALVAALADAWRRTNVDHVVAYMRSDNPVSIRLAEKIGFSFSATGTHPDGDGILVYSLPRPR